MRLPLKVATAIRARKLLAPGASVLIGLSGGPDSVALFHCLLELSQKRDLHFTLAAAHLNHRIRGKSAGRDLEFCRRLCVRFEVKLYEAQCETKELAAHLRRSLEETARLARRAFLTQAARACACTAVAVAHHADDRIETVLYRLCRGTGLSGLEGIGWSGPLELTDAPSVASWVTWPAGVPPAAAHTNCDPAVVRPLLGITREEILAYLRSKRQRYCTDETNFDTRIPRNAVRRLVLPVLEKKVHPGARAALWRLAEEAELHAERRAWRRGWLQGIAALNMRGYLALPVSRGATLPTLEELSEILGLLRVVWNLAHSEVGSKQLHNLRTLFGPSGAKREVPLPGRLIAERDGPEVRIRRAAEEAQPQHLFAKS